MKLPASLQRKEVLWLLITTILILVLSSIPYVVGYQLETDTKVFGGAFFDRQDVAVHMASMQTGRQGDWLYHFRFTSEEHQGYPVKMFYILLGQLGRIIPLSIPALFHLARLTGGFLALGTIYLLISEFFEQIYWRRIAFLLVLLGAGLGWLQLVTGWIPNEQISPIDYWYMDPYILFGLMILPHFAFITAGVAAIPLLYLHYLREPRWLNIFVIVFIAFFLQIINPLTPLLADAAIGTIWLVAVWRDRVIAWRPLLVLTVIAVLQIPLVLYNIQIFSVDPFWSQFFAQNETLSPPFVYHLYGFALLWPFALVGIWQAFRQRSPQQIALVAWLVVAFLLAYVPVNVQRRFLHALMIPMGILTILGLRASWTYLNDRFPSNWFVRRSRVWTILYLAFAMMTTLTISLGYSAFLATHPETLYDDADLSLVSAWMVENLDNDAVLFCSHTNCQHLAAHAGVIVFTGHPMETLRYEEKTIEVEDFYAGKIPVEDQYSWLQERNVDYVLYGPQDYTLDDQKDFVSTFPLVFEAGGVALYEVVP